ncbi:hypothetical protein [Amycolatopsis sp. NPDC051071]|uniref:hypothetical protein n=1 Tax=Amycolatopsis sp. NPDC051071 TaxID=3154637 RepID=UPI003446104F
MSETKPTRSEVEAHPADPHFNPGHPQNRAWSSGPKPPEMPAEAGIVEMFQEPGGPISGRDVTIQKPAIETEDSTADDKSKTPRKR